jgi:hypothetical protein
MRAVDAAAAMGERAPMPRTAWPVAVLLLAAIGPCAGPNAAQALPAAVIIAAAPAPIVQVQARVQARRARPKIRVRPRYPHRRYHSAYPLPYDTEHPGPNAVRRCVDWYATEHRPSGTVVVPRMRCWWVRG